MQSNKLLSRREVVISPGDGTGHFFRALIEQRYLVWLLTYRNFRARYKQAVLGVAWAFITPFAYTIIFFGLFSLAKLPSSQSPLFFHKVLAGMVLWQFFARSVTEASSSISSNAGLISKVYFPRQILPLTAILATLVDLAINLLILFVFVIFADTHWTGWRLLLVPLAMAWTAVLVFGLSLATSAMEALYRDVRHAIPLIVQLGMFATPVAYAISDVPEKWQGLLSYNPMAIIVELFRAGIFPDQVVPSFMSAVPAVGVTCLLFVLGTFLFSSVEGELVDKA